MPKKNLLLEGLPSSTRTRLRAHLEEVNLPRETCLINVGEPVRHAYFPAAGLVSLLASTSTGGSAEVATVGPEGFVGIPILLGGAGTNLSAIVRLSGSAFRIRADVLRQEIGRDEALRMMMLGYADRFSAEVAQAVVCQCFHNVLQRLCSWLLAASDRTGEDTLKVTQDGLMQALGVAHSAMSKAIAELHDADAIMSSRGRILIRNRHRLEATACECYRALQAVRNRREGRSDPSPRASTSYS